MSNAPRQSHEPPTSSSPPVASVQGTNPVIDNSAPTGSQVTAESHSSKSRALCRFYNTKKGCRAGAQCPYRHEEGGQPAESRQLPKEKSPARSVPLVTRELPQRRRDDVSSRAGVVAKPVPDAQKTNPREFQILQVTRRFSPTRQEEGTGTRLTFKLVPSDPDFPFELAALQCELTIPKTWPNDGKPRLLVKNNEIPKGYQINIENGFASLITPGRTLLALLNELDKNLEKFLTAQKAPTIKLVANAAQSKSSPTVEPQKVQPKPTKPVSQAPVAVLIPAAPTYTSQQKESARSKRDADVRQLEGRMSRAALFSRSADGTSFNVPVQIPKTGTLPVSLRELKEITLSVPRLYNLEPCLVRLKGVSGNEARNVEMAFEKHARQDQALTLMAHVNHLTQHIHFMAANPVSVPAPSIAQPEVIQRPDADPAYVPATQDKAKEEAFDKDRPHIKYIPRPPEWDSPAGDSEGESSDFDDSNEDEAETEAETEDEDHHNDGGAALPSTATTTAVSSNSIVVSFPEIQLFGIELLELASLSLTLKCDRCKTLNDITKLKPSTFGNTLTLTESCSKCANSLMVTFHAEPLHANSIKGGHLDLTSCTVADMLPSVFTPTCSECSTPYPTPPGVISVRGDTSLAVCRGCHRKMTFKIAEVKFLRVAAHVSNMPLPPRKRKVKENLGIVTGTSLPKNGKCSHYRKSCRWFRFSCCAKVFPCDRCHDEQAEPKHMNEHANRMICGFCSREQNFRPEDCGFCGSSLVGRKGGGFWEGGQGTRDKTRMSRKDPRKYKRRVGTAPRGA